MIPGEHACFPESMRVFQEAGADAPTVLDPFFLFQRFFPSLSATGVEFFARLALPVPGQ